MNDKNILEQLLDAGTLSTVLCKGRAKKEEVIEFQTLLHQLGFDDELNYAKFGADGYYGGSCVNAVKAFGKRNGITTDGTAVSEELAKAMIARYDSLDELQDLQKEIDAGTVESSCKKGSTDKGAIASLQTLLNDLGYGKELNWDRYKNDGMFGRSTITALQAFFKKEGLQGNGEVLTEEAVKTIRDLLGQYYGTSWKQNLKVTAKSAGTENKEGGLVLYTGSQFQGKKLWATPSFIPNLNKLNQFAKENSIKIHVTSSWRANANVSGAIVTPAKRSNHMAGHAIDMNLVYPGGWANSSYLKNKNEENWDPSVTAFVKAIRDDKEQRWGGDFTPEDPVHIDDGLNVRDSEAWDKCYKETQMT